ncbi:MAG TPA: GNAT family N-acetyltransferase [Gemmatimonadaceae bacterium]|nr:GNAT family N-acetyltransferase [Gemmatimonadaceae bacterium]
MRSSSISIREARPEDVPALARLHVETFIETHGGVNPPTYELRERQWRAALGATDGSGFCFVAETPTGELVGFARGTLHVGGVPGFQGELNKIYLLRRHQRTGVGRRLVGHVARRFQARGIDAMLLFGDARSPSNGFYEALGAERLVSETGEFHGGYGWRDLRRLTTICPID